MDDADRPADFRGRFLRDPRETAAYAGASGILRLAPAAVALPADATDVQSLVRWSAATRTPLVPRGAGTGMPGGNVGTGVVVDLADGARRIGPVDAGRRTVTVEPGATLGALNDHCAPLGLRFPVDPSSGQRCSLGGMLANNAAGAHSVKYGATRDWVEALEVVWSDGSRGWIERGAPVQDPAARARFARIAAALAPRAEWIESAWPRVRKNSSGYALREFLRSGDAVDLLVGSEGTLGLIVAARLRLDPVPAETGVAVVEFTSLEAAGAAVQALLPLRPATCEMLDRTFLDLVRSAGEDAAAFPLSPDLEAILLVEVEGDSKAEVRERLAAVVERTRSLAARASTAREPERQHRFWEIRHAASPIIAARARGRVSMQFIEDGVVPVDRLPDYVLLLRSTLARHDLPAVIFGHAGDGNLHVNPLVDVSDERWRATLDEVLREIADGIARLGGTLAGEHGDGRLRAPLLEVVWGAEMVHLFRMVKDELDPLGILNPGVVLPLPGQRPFDALGSY